MLHAVIYAVCLIVGRSMLQQNAGDCEKDTMRNFVVDALTEILQTALHGSRRKTCAENRGAPFILRVIAAQMHDVSWCQTGAQDDTGAFQRFGM